MQRGAIILCGGKSTRMGEPKATLPFGEESMLARVVRLVGDVVPKRSIVVVAASGQEFHDLPKEITLAYDDREDQGPLEGLRVGLAALAGHVEAAYATACDVPLLVPAFVDRMFSLLGDSDIAVPVEGRFHHPLAAVYRPDVMNLIESLLADGLRRPFTLFERCQTRFVPIDEMRAVDPELATLRNLNTPDDYQAALRSAGF